MKQPIFYILLISVFLFANCKKDDVENVSYRSLDGGQSAFEAYEAIQDLYEKQVIFDLLVQDSFSTLVASKHFLSLYHDFVILDSVHSDSMQEFKFHFENDTLNSILLYPELIAVEQWPTYQVSTTILYPGIKLDSIFYELNTVNQLDTFERIINLYLDYKNLEKRFSNNMYAVDSWFATEKTEENEEYTIELIFKKGVLKDIERYRK